MKVRIKKLSPNAILPSYAKEGDAGMDLTAISKQEGLAYIEYGTGLAIEIPEGYVGLVFPRSSISKTGLDLCNAVGMIDSGYRGEIMARFRKIVVGGDYSIGDRIAQLMILPYPQITLEESDELSETDRGQGAFGSTNTYFQQVNLSPLHYLHNAKDNS
jgi:dUTP pyrophosphatase